MLERTDNVEGDARERSTALRDALRRARAEAAERSDVVIDMRQAEAARLAVLYDALEPVFAQVPYDVDIFDVGIAKGERPRLFVDMVSFVEMARDKRTYRFVRDGRHGRVVAAESGRVEPIVEAITAYVARRLIERERLLADEDRISELDAEASESALPKPTAAAPEQVAVSAPPSAPRRHAAWIRILTIFAAFVVGGGLGAAVVVAMIAAIAKGYLPV